MDIISMQLLLCWLAQWLRVTKRLVEVMWSLLSLWLCCLPPATFRNSVATAQKQGYSDRTYKEVKAPGGPEQCHGAPNPRWADRWAHPREANQCYHKPLFWVSSHQILDTATSSQSEGQSTWHCCLTRLGEQGSAWEGWKRKTATGTEDGKMLTDVF